MSWDEAEMVGSSIAFSNGPARSRSQGAYLKSLASAMPARCASARLFDPPPPTNRYFRHPHETGDVILS